MELAEYYHDYPMTKEYPVDKEVNSWEAPASGFTAMPNVIFDDLMADLTATEFKVYMYIARRTYGFQKNRDAISISQMVDGITKADGTVLDRGTNLSKRTVIRAVGGLVEKGRILKAMRTHEGHGGQMPNRYTMTPLKDSAPPLCHPDTPPVSEIHQGCVNVTPTKESEQEKGNKTSPQTPQRGAGKRGKKRSSREPATAPVAIEAIRRDDRFGEKGVYKRMMLWEVAEKWDFTREDEEPPMRLRFKISKDRSEYLRMLASLRSISRRAIKGEAAPSLSEIPEGSYPHQPAEEPQGVAQREEEADHPLTAALDEILDRNDGRTARLAAAAVIKNYERVVEILDDEFSEDLNGHGVSSGIAATTTISLLRQRLEAKANA